MHTSPQAEQPFHEHFADHGCVLVSQNGLHSDSAPHSEQPLQPCQVHLSPQACVLSSQYGLHAGAGREHSEQPLQPVQVHLSSHACVLSSQNGWHSGSGTMHSVQPVQPPRLGGDPPIFVYRGYTGHSRMRRPGDGRAVSFVARSILDATSIYRCTAVLRWHLHTRSHFTILGQGRGDTVVCRVRSAGASWAGKRPPRRPTLGL